MNLENVLSELSQCKRKCGMLPLISRIGKSIKKSRSEVIRDLGVGIGNYCFMGIEFLLGMMKIFRNDDGNVTL
jgi:hypothetical protein